MDHIAQTSPTIVTFNDAIRPRERDQVIQALRAGVVPKLGLQYIQTGRAGEVGQVVADMDRITNGGSAIRMVIGAYGAGKTFFLSLARTIATQKRLVVVSADLSPDRRLHSSGGHAQALYSELMRNMATKTKPDGALESVVERFIDLAREEAETSGQTFKAIVRKKLAPLQVMVSSHDFLQVIDAYVRGSEEGDPKLKADAIRWLRGEYSSKTEARMALGVRSIIEDAAVYDYLKVMALFVTAAGFEGLLVMADECVNLYKLINVQTRTSNYEQVLRIVNDVMQGSAERIGFYFGGTPEFLMDSRRGLYSYEALRSRLAENNFAKDGLTDLSGPVLRLQALTPEELFVLLGRLRHVFAGGDTNRYLVPDAALHAFMAHCMSKLGNESFRTPRNTIKAFLDLLAVLDQNPGAVWSNLIKDVDIKADVAAPIEDIADLPAPALVPPVTTAHSTQQKPKAAAEADDLMLFKL